MMQGARSLLSRLALAACAAVATGTPSPAIELVSSELRVQLRPVAGIRSTPEIVIEIARGAIGAATGSRTAQYEAVVRSNRVSGGDATSFFGDMPLLIGAVGDADGTASAAARNVLRGKVCRADAVGVAAAACVLAWNGRAAWQVVAPIDLVPSLDPPPAGTLPDPAQVESAMLAVRYAVPRIEVELDANLKGGVQIDVEWNGIDSFAGGASFALGEDLGAGEGRPAFAGDLAAYAPSFSSDVGALRSSDLTLTDEVLIPVDYAALIASGVITGGIFIGELAAEVAGRMSASAFGVGGEVIRNPEPASIAIIAMALPLLACLRRRRHCRSRGLPAGSGPASEATAS